MAARRPLRTLPPPSPALSTATAITPSTASPSPTPASSSEQPAQPYPLLHGHRSEFAKDARRPKRRKLQNLSAAQLIETRDKFTDAIEGRDRETLAMWDEGYQELWELLQERDKLAELEQLHLKKIDRLSDRCFDLDEKVDELKARCAMLEARLAEHGLPTD